MKHSYEIKEITRQVRERKVRALQIMSRFQSGLEMIYSTHFSTWRKITFYKLRVVLKLYFANTFFK